MLNVFSLNDKDIWDRVVKSYANWDIYYLSGYAETFRIHGDGEPSLISFEDGDDRFCYVVMQRDISEDPKFESHLEPGRYYDLETPYGYGGPLCDHPVSGQAQKKFITEFTEFAKNRRIVSQFIRFHPLLYNHEVLPDVIETRYLHQTVFIDTSSPELIMANMDSKNRNMVRKAQKNGVTILRRPIDDYHDFLPIYEETMRKDDADDYYFFDGKYFEQQIYLKDNACIFYAMREGCPIAAAMMYYNDRYMHYHLAGTRTDSRKYSPGNLLLYEAACWASSRGIRQFHLGGGMEEDDNLFGFKKQFNKNGRLPFYIGRTIFDKCSFDLLKDLRKQINENFDTDNSRMIQYRA